ncbi:MAG TPA: phage integrase N-terminal SAM-like domain-containing protein [Bacteroidota bacterium]|nr:phage integrase N-terminal SAM-like domain-containing protein [Bacteroidota bacterium]
MASKLLNQVREIIRLRHLSIRTEEAYVQWIKRYILFHHKRHPAEMGEIEIRNFLKHLACEKYVSSSTQNQALNASTTDERFPRSSNSCCLTLLCILPSE